MCQPQPPIPVETEDTASNIIMNGTAKKNRYRAIDMIIIGYVTEYDKIFSIYYGRKEGKIWKIMSQITTRYGIIEIRNQDI